MKTLKFKTNIKCSGCVAKVTPHLDGVEGIEKWEVDVLNPNKVLTVIAHDDKTGQIQKVVEQSGFKVEVL
jgi:copper chaperone